MEAPTAAKMEAGVRGSGAEAAGNCSLVTSSSAVWQRKRELQVPAGGARGWWRGPLCEAGGAGGRGERGLLSLRTLVYCPSPAWGADYECQSAVR